KRDGSRRALRELVGPVLHRGVKLCGRDDLVDQAHLTRLFGGVALVEVPDLTRFLVADMARQEGGAPAGVNRADLGADLPELCGVSRYRQVAKRCEHVTAADRKAVDPCDHRFRYVADQALQFINRQADHTAAVILALMRRLIAARAERLI